jgi:hypothetical protein
MEKTRKSLITAEMIQARPSVWFGAPATIIKAEISQGRQFFIV